MSKKGIITQKRKGKNINNRKPQKEIKHKGEEEGKKCVTPNGWHIGILLNPSKPFVWKRKFPPLMAAHHIGIGELYTISDM